MYASAALQGLLFRQLVRRLPRALTAGEAALVAGSLARLAANTTWLTIGAWAGPRRRRATCLALVSSSLHQSARPVLVGSVLFGMCGYGTMGVAQPL